MFTLRRRFVSECNYSSSITHHAREQQKMNGAQHIGLQFSVHQTPFLIPRKRRACPSANVIQTSDDCAYTGAVLCEHDSILCFRCLTCIVQNRREIDLRNWSLDAPYLVLTETKREECVYPDSSRRPNSETSFLLRIGRAWIWWSISMDYTA